MQASAVQADVREEQPDFCVANLDGDLRVLEANDDFLHKIGRSAPEVYGQHFGDSSTQHEQVILQHLGRLADGTRLRFSTRFVGVRC